MSNSVAPPAEQPAAPPIAPLADARNPQTQTRPRSRMPWIWLAAAVVLGAGIYGIWRYVQTPAASASASGRKGGAGAAATPVVATTARKGDINVYYTGLGSVTPIQTVTVKSRVDGQLMSVAYKEGDLVHKGDPLAEIDPRPYQVQLTLAQ